MIAAIQLLMVRNDGPIDEVGTTMIHSAGYSSTGASLVYAIDCDNNGGYETSGDAFGSGSCAFSDDGSFAVGDVRSAVPRMPAIAIPAQRR